MVAESVGESTIFVSPFSIATVLAMAHPGMLGNTANQVKSALHKMKFGKKFVVLDFVASVLLTDVFIPSCVDWVTISVDVWSKTDRTIRAVCIIRRRSVVCDRILLTSL